MANDICKAYVLTSEWQLLEPYDEQRRGIILQNQSANDPNNLLVSSGQPSSDFAAVELMPNGALIRDILSPSNQIWGKSSNGATLTLILQY